MENEKEIQYSPLTFQYAGNIRRLPNPQQIHRVAFGVEDDACKGPLLKVEIFLVNGKLFLCNHQSKEAVKQLANSLSNSISEYAKLYEWDESIKIADNNLAMQILQGFNYALTCYEEEIIKYSMKQHTQEEQEAKNLPWYKRIFG